MGSWRTGPDAGITEGRAGRARALQRAEEIVLLWEGKQTVFAVLLAVLRLGGF